MHLKEGRDYVAAEAKTDPNNLMAVYIADYEDCLLLLINCDRTEYEQRKDHFSDRLTQLEKGDKNSPWYRLCRAGVYLHLAIVNTRLGDQYKAALNFRRSFSLLHENMELFPRFEYNNIFAGLQESVVGSLPGSYKWLAAVFGMKGSIKAGTSKITAFVNSHSPGQPFYEETVLYYLYTSFYLLSDQQKVWNFLNSRNFTTHNNLINTFVKINIALDYRKADAAIETLRSAAAEPEFEKYPIFDYQFGAALLTRLDTTAAAWLEQYLAKNKSNVYIKDAWQKTAFAWYTNNNTAKAQHALEQIKTQGTTRIDADKQANKFAENNAWPPIPLLQARLLIEGGYYERALAVLQHMDMSLLNTPPAKAEYYFRLGRAYEELAISNPGKGYYQQAFAQYRNTISTGKERHEQFAARAALQMGKMMEQLGMKQEALAKYRECLDMPSHDFQNSIDQQAKSGINRIESDL